MASLSHISEIQNSVRSPGRAREGQERAKRGNKKRLAKDSGCTRQNMASSSNQEEGKATRKKIRVGFIGKMTKKSLA